MPKYKKNVEITYPMQIIMKKKKPIIFRILCWEKVNVVAEVFVEKANDKNCIEILKYE